MFQLEKVIDEKFDTFDDAFAFVSEEKRRIARLSLTGFWNSGARFHEDGSLGTGNTSFKFNPYGFQALCDLLGVWNKTLHRLQTPELASDVLNDLLSGAVKDNKKAVSAEIIVDEKDGTVIGVVSDKYVGYSNDAFLRDVLICIDGKNNGALFPDTGDFAFKEAYSINSRLFLRLSSKSVRGVVSGRGGQGEDISEIGVEVSNSMAGGHAVRLSWFVFRLICANGLVSQVGGSKGHIRHSGIEDGFRKRLYASTNGLFSGLGKARKMVENLGGIAFDPARLAKYADLKLLFSVVPNRDLKKEALDRAKGEDYSGLPKKERELQSVSDAIASLPFCFGGKEALSVFSSNWRDGASMYDFVNIFTEYAKALPNGQKIEVETKAGALASWISQNKRKFA
jgi:hypothetical protein